MAPAGRWAPAATRPRRSRRGHALASALLLAYGMLTLFVASAWGPGNSDELVSGGAELIPWYGLPAVGTLAALVGLVLALRSRAARRALLTAATSLAGWTAFLFSLPD